MPVEDPAFETVHLLDDEFVAILPPGTAPVPKRVTPAYLARRPLDPRQLEGIAASPRP